MEPEIRFYAKGNPLASQKMEEADRSNDRNQLFRFYKRFVSGDFTDGTPVFYLGDLKDKVQIRISARDGNDKPPSNAYTKGEEGCGDVHYWVNFFDITDEDDVARDLSSVLGDSI